MEPSKEYKPIIDNLADKFKRKHKLRLEPKYVHKADTTLKVFLRMLIACPYLTVKVSDPTKVQCKVNAHRSLGDMYKISEYYYPGLELNTFLKELETFLSTGGGYNFCPTVRKTVFQNVPYYQHTYKDENGLNNDFYRDLKQKKIYAQ